jgi:hypothetical protein
MQVGESIAVAMASQGEDKCAICGKKHKDPKKETFTKTAGKTGWKRVTMSSKFERIPAKLAIYPGNAFPPSYSHEGHHSLALSSFVANEKTNPTDVRLRLNFYLDKIGYSPNRHENSIGLPGRPGFSAFWQALDANKPLQMHIGDHDDSFMGQTAALLSRMVGMIADKDVCKDVDQSEWESILMDMITCAENYAFIKLASNATPWRLHPVDHLIAIEVYFMPASSTKTFQRKSEKVTLTGRGNKKKPIKWPSPSLHTGPFG